MCQSCIFVGYVYITMSLGICVVSVSINIVYNVFSRCTLYGVLQLVSEHADS